jgi:hypothetical protein
MVPSSENFEPHTGKIYRHIRRILERSLLFLWRGYIYSMRFRNRLLLIFLSLLFLWRGYIYSMRFRNRFVDIFESKETSKIVKSKVHMLQSVFSIYTAEIFLGTVSLLDSVNLLSWRLMQELN